MSTWFCKSKPTLQCREMVERLGPVNKPWVTYAQGEVFHWNVFGSDALDWIKIKPPNNEPLVQTLGLQKTNHTERNHTESGLLVHLLITSCKRTCPPFILVAKEQPHAWGIWNSFSSPFNNTSKHTTCNDREMLALCPATKITTTIALKRIGCLSK